MNKPLALILTILVVMAGVIYYDRFLVSRNDGADVVACTEEAKICPDGSAVGRVGPKCEFAECPSVSPGNTAKIGQKITVSGISITPIKVESESRCPSDVTCVWAGEVKLRVKLFSEGNEQELTLTTESPITFAGKIISLESVSPTPNSKNSIASEDYFFVFSVSATISSKGGVLKGTMTMGPICPVERIDNPCKPTPEMFASMKILVYSGSGKKTLIATLIPDAEGKFSINLNAGKYILDSESKGIGGISEFPMAIDIVAGKTLSINIDVDTGIR